MLTSQNEAIEIIGTVGTVARKALELKLPGCEGKEGAYFSMAHAGVGVIILCPIINPWEEKARRSALFCQEKAHRLVNHPNHLTSRESANENLEQYPGAIRLSDLHEIFSISGFPADVDEAIALRAAVTLRRMSDMSALVIAARVPAVQSYFSLLTEALELDNGN